MPEGNGSASPVLEVCGARKSYGLIRALDDVSLRLDESEVLALLGDNGAGKSTLIKAISGVLALDEGQIRINGEEMAFRSAHDARAAGIDTVYQDLAVFDNLDALSNFFIGRERRSPSWLGTLGVLQRREMQRDWAGYVERLGLSVRDPNQVVGLMSGGQRQAIAVARAVAFARRIVIMDEPTAALGIRESTHVLDLIKRLPAHGVSVIVIAHNLEHITRVADRAIVLRQGKNVGEITPTPANHERLVSLIVGGHGSEPP